MIPIINEATVSSVNDKAQNGFFIISADNYKYTPQQYEQKVKQLASNIKTNRLKFYIIMGMASKNQNTASEINYSKTSLLVLYNSQVISKEDFMKLATDLCITYNQNHIIYKSPASDVEESTTNTNICLLDSSGNITKDYNKTKLDDTILREYYNSNSFFQTNVNLRWTFDLTKGQ